MLLREEGRHPYRQHVTGTTDMHTDLSVFLTKKRLLLSIHTYIACREQAFRVYNNKRKLLQGRKRGLSFFPSFLPPTHRWKDGSRINKPMMFANLSFTRMTTEAIDARNTNK